jgi:putative pyruvate formate lyase activating enzyme
VARAALHFWEEPCLSGEEGSGTVFFSGCALGCVYCQNHAISKGPHGKAVSVERLSEIFLELQGKGANNVNLVTPSHFAPQIAAAIGIARRTGLAIPVVYNCGGYEKVETLRALEGLVDIYLPDFKYFSPGPAVKYSRCADYFEAASAALREMVRQAGEAAYDARGIMQKGVIVRHLVLPGYLEDSKNVIRYLYEAYGDLITLSIMNQYTPVAPAAAHPELSRKVTEEEYAEVVEFAVALGVTNAFVQEGETASESFIPAFDGEGV